MKDSELIDWIKGVFVKNMGPYMVNLDATNYNSALSLLSDYRYHLILEEESEEEQGAAKACGLTGMVEDHQEQMPFGILKKAIFYLSKYDLERLNTYMMKLMAHHHIVSDCKEQISQIQIMIKQSEEELEKIKNDR